MKRTEGNIEGIVSGLMHSVRRGSKSRACSTEGCQGTWEIQPSPRERVAGKGLRHRRSTEEEPETATPRCLATRSSAWYREVRNQNDMGQTDASRSTSIVPGKLANRCPHVRICRGPGRVIAASVYPTAPRASQVLVSIWLACEGSPLSKKTLAGRNHALGNYAVEDAAETFARARTVSATKHA